jgi:hypothetical protein
MVFIIPPFLSAPLDLRRFMVHKFHKFADLYLLDVCVGNLCNSQRRAIFPAGTQLF